MNLAPIIDHTNLKPDASAEDIRQLCREAAEYGFASVCVNASRTALAAELLKDSPVKVCTVVGFPLGACGSKAKAFEAQCAAADGAGEIDMVIDIGAVRDGNLEAAREDVAAVVKAVPGHTVKVIIECCLLSDDEKKTACQAAMEGGAHFVKTSTGFSTGGATVEDVRLMRAAVGGRMKIKAAGGIRDAKTALAMVEAGADRIGASKSVQIAKDSQR